MTYSKAFNKKLKEPLQLYLKPLKLHFKAWTDPARAAGANGGRAGHANGAAQAYGVDARAQRRLQVSRLSQWGRVPTSDHEYHPSPGKFINMLYYLHD